MTIYGAGLGKTTSPVSNIFRLRLWSFLLPMNEILLFICIWGPQWDGMCTQADVSVE